MYLSVTSCCVVGCTLTRHFGCNFPFLELLRLNDDDDDDDDTEQNWKVEWLQ